MNGVRLILEKYSTGFGLGRLSDSDKTQLRLDGYLTKTR